MKKILIVNNDLQNGGITTAMVNLYNEIKDIYDVYILVLNGDNLDSIDKRRFIKRHLFVRLAGISINKYKSEKSILKKLMLLILGALKKIIGYSKWVKLCYSLAPEIRGFDVAISYRQGFFGYEFVDRCVVADKKFGFVHADIRYADNPEQWIRYASKFKLLCVSNGVADRIKSEFPQYAENIATCYNVLSLDSIHDLSERYEPEEYESGYFTIVTVSRLTEEKGIFRIIDAVKVIKANNIKDVRWYVVGDGEDGQKFRELVDKYNCEDIIKILGWKENPYPYLKKADIFAFPTKNEAYPMVVLESMALETPVLTTEYISAHEQINNGINGIIVENNSKSFAEGMMCVLENRNKIDIFREYLRNNRYTNEAAIKQLCDNL